MFLNKQDVLEKKIKTSNLKDHFPGYTVCACPPHADTLTHIPLTHHPRHSTQGPAHNYEKAKDFILSMYLSKRPATHDVYHHFTMATDTENINFVFNSVRSTILRLHLKDYNLY